LIFADCDPKLAGMKKSQSTVTAEHIRALRDGDQQALRHIFDELQPKVQRFLWLKIKSVEIAEDLVQETFLRLWENRARLKPEAKIETYIFRIASNLATDQLRKADRHKELPTEDHVATADGSTNLLAEGNQLAQIVDQILHRLPDAPRTVFILSRYEGLSHKEIGAVLNISIKTVEKHIGKALRFLKTELEKLDLISTD